MVNIKSKREIELMKHAGHVNYLCHEQLKAHIAPGITTSELNRIAHDFIISHECSPSFLNYDGFPGSICTSINDEVVHGIPNNRKLKEGDIISIDIGVKYKGYHSDAARTHAVGTISEEKANLIKYTEESFYEGLKYVKEGARVGDISAAIEKYARAHNLGVVEELVGHGVGTNLHEEPDVPNFGIANSGMRLKSGMVIAIEPMLNLGTKKIEILDDEWTIVTKDGKDSSHYEHTVLVTEDGYEILTGENKIYG